LCQLLATVTKLGIDLPVSTIMARVKQSHRVAQAKIKSSKSGGASAGQKPASQPASLPASPPANPPEEVDNDQNEGRFVVASHFVSLCFCFCLSLYKLSPTTQTVVS
jgi:hypothetical protein